MTLFMNEEDFQGRFCRPDYGDFFWNYYYHKKVPEIVCYEL